MGSEITIIARAVDVPALLADLRDLEQRRSDLQLTVAERVFAGRVTWLWGRMLTGVSDELWGEAQMEADAGEGTIETIEPDDGSASFEAIVFAGPYRAHTMAALWETGQPTFEYATTFVSLDITIAGAHLSLNIDQTTGATGSPHRKDDDDEVTYLSSADSWVGRDGQATAAHHAAVIEVLDVLARHSSLEVFDSTGYWEHRNELGIVAAMAAHRELRADLRRALADYDFDRTPAPEPPMTIARLLGGKS